MFVDTERDKIVRKFLTDELLAAMNRVRSDVSQLRRGSHTRGLRTALRSNVVTLQTVYAMWSKVGGWDVMPATDAEYHSVVSQAASVFAAER